VHTPEILPGDAIEVTALWDLRDGPGDYVITVTADAFSQIDQVRTDDSFRQGTGLGTRPARRTLLAAG
jgi:hypothetical protein